MPNSREVCYRCRKTSNKNDPLNKCDYCSLFWHLSCLIQPLTEIPEHGWKCPRHLERSHTRRHKKKHLNGSLIKVVQPEEDMTFNEANDILRYGGFVYGANASTIESEFLNYARKYRQSLSTYKNQTKEPDNEKTNAEKWLESLPSFELFENKPDGIQLLIDASNVDVQKPLEPTGTDSEIEIGQKEYERFEAIEELIRLKGEDELLKLLTK